MKKLFLAFAAAAFLASCNNAADAEKSAKDSIDSLTNLQKESVDEAAKDAKQTIDSTMEMKKDSVDSIHGGSKDTTKKM